MQSDPYKCIQFFNAFVIHANLGGTTLKVLKANEDIDYISEDDIAVAQKVQSVCFGALRILSR